CYTHFYYFCAVYLMFLSFYRLKIAVFLMFDISFFLSVAFTFAFDAEKAVKILVKKRIFTAYISQEIKGFGIVLNKRF
ncbi:MAG: hypothetical protein IJN05_07135, partial [Ruminococcus sp.]|nr:hypothetical protein [Ruminococcus sp.]